MESIADKAESPSLGQALGDERERQGLSRNDIAQRLHMSAWQVEALETGDHARLPKGPFLRGFVRNYAKLLALAPDPLLTMLAEAAPKAAAPGIVVPSQNIRFDPTNQRYQTPYIKAGVIALFVVIVGLAAMYWWVAIRTSPPGAPAPVPAVALARKAPAGPVPQNIAVAPVPAPDPVVMREAPLVAESATVEPQPPLPGGKRFKFRFKGPSWVEIRDGRGKVLISKLNPAGSVAEVSGRPPFEVIVGNAPAVDMTYEDRQFPLEPHTRVAVARFTVE